ncbi:hypothetical protein SK128_007147 [Halocaridina rubra]|uniref:Uncharacterized protein n=1 Tax=Halocaridina rubra TaxID=373956 RepID=A0AAN8WQ45_HALRR
MKECTEKSTRETPLRGFALVCWELERCGGTGIENLSTDSPTPYMLRGGVDRATWERCCINQPPSQVSRNSEPTQYVLRGGAGRATCECCCNNQPPSLAPLLFQSKVKVGFLVMTLTISIAKSVLS